MSATPWLGAALGLICAAGCSQSDVGAPCQHAQGDVPSDPVISFPSLACEQLLCVFGETINAPPEPCDSDADCTRMSGGVDSFVCENNLCAVAQETVLERSMCSTTCDSDAECADFVDGTRCETGFTCAPLMSLGDFCCQKVCVCRDGLDVAGSDKLEAACQDSDVPGCCDRDPLPKGCG